jgi:hypothetical protein
VVIRDAFYFPGAGPGAVAGPGAWERRAGAAGRGRAYGWPIVPVPVTLKFAST